MIRTHRFISFEGGDGAGKSSHIDWLADLLTQRGEQVVRTREPGGTPLGEKLRTLLLSDAMDIDTELMLMYAARRQHLVEVIEPALAAGRIVITDRFEDSTYAYQGGGRSIDFDRIQQIGRCCRGPRPDLTLFFDLSVEVALKRLEGTRDLDRFEKEGRDFHERVRAAYHRRAKIEPKRIVIIDANRSIQDIRLGLTELFKFSQEA